MNDADGTNGNAPAWPTEEDRVRAAKESYVSGETESLEALATYFSLDLKLLEERRRIDNWDLDRRQLDEEKAEATADRAPNGRFLPGHTIKSPGRPRRDEEAAWLEILRTEVTAVRWEAVVRKALEQALRGDARARQWLSDYVLPQASKVPAPEQRIEIVYESLDDAITRSERVERLRAAAEVEITDGLIAESVEPGIDDAPDPADDFDPLPPRGKPGGPPRGGSAREGPVSRG